MGISREELQAKMAELGKLTPEERSKAHAERRAAMLEPKKAEHAKLLAQAEDAKLIAEEEYGVGRVRLLEDKEGYGGGIVIRVPENHEYAHARSVFRSDTAKQTSKHDAEERLIRACVVWPPVEEWNELVKRTPSWHTPAALACWTLCQLVESDTEEK